MYKVCAEFEYDALLLGIRGELRPNANEDVEKLIEDMLALTITLPVERLTVIPSPAVLLIESTPELAVLYQMQFVSHLLMDHLEKIQSQYSVVPFLNHLI